MWDGWRQRAVGGVTAAMVLLASAYCACAAAMMSAHRPATPMPGSHQAMSCCAAPSDGQAPAAPAHEPSHSDCPHCQQSMTAGNAPTVDLSAGLHAWGWVGAPDLSIRLQPLIAVLWTAGESPPLPTSRQRLRLHCALLI